MITSVNIAEWGPCCSTAPTGMITVEDFSNQFSSSLFVSSPRNTVGAFMTENRSHPLERAPAESLGKTVSIGGVEPRYPDTEQVARRHKSVGPEYGLCSTESPEIHVRD